MRTDDVHAHRPWHPRASRALALAVLMILASWGAQAASAVHKCVAADGKVSYQGEPCAATQPSARPTVEQLNRERRHRLSQAASASAANSNPAPATAAAPVTAAPPPLAPPPAVSGSPAAAGLFRCDGRRYCSQMRSCAEAQYFLANCPGVHMDGDGDGIPCEDQWCSKR